MADAILLTGGGSNADVEGQQVTNTDVYPGDVFLDLDGTPATGSMATLGAQTIQPKNTNQTISAGRYLVGAQTIAPVVVANLSAANVKQGITIGVGYAGATGAIATAAGTFTNDANATKNGIRSGYKGWVKGQEVVGELGSVAAKTWSPSTAVQTISGSTYYGGAQKLNAIPGNANSAQVVNNYTFGSTNGANLTGSIPVYTRSTPITPSTATQTITTAIQNHYVTSDIAVSGVSLTNFSAANIKKGVNITIAQKTITGSFDGFVSGAFVYNAGSWGSGYANANFVAAKRGRRSGDAVKAYPLASIAFQSASIKITTPARTPYEDSEGYTQYTHGFLDAYMTKAINASNYSVLQIEGNTGTSQTLYDSEEYQVTLQKTADYAHYQYNTSGTGQWPAYKNTTYCYAYGNKYISDDNVPYIIQVDVSDVDNSGYLLLRPCGQRPTNQSTNVYVLITKIYLF